MKGLPYYTILLLGTLFLIPSQSKADHIMGVDLTYECLDSCTIRLNLRAYRACSGISTIFNTVTFDPLTPGCGQPVANNAWSTQFTQEVTPLCPSVQSQCSNSTAQISGVQEYFWFREYDICSVPGCIFTIGWSDCCRNPSITSGAAYQGISINTTTLNTNIVPCNSSPQFSNPPVPYICQGQSYVFNQGATDAEGDSLAYALGQCSIDSFNNSINYAAGYSSSMPLGPTWNVSVNPVTGDISVIPNPSGAVVVGVMCVYVEEWRNGVLINTIVRDIQLTVIPCPSNTLPSSPGVSNVSGANINGPFEITVCEGNPFSFDIVVSDPDPGQVHQLFWNLSLVSNGATFTQGVQTDSISGNQPTGTFDWIPQATGTYVATFTMQDDACPFIGANQYSVTINVVNGLPNPGITVTQTGCTNVSLSANPGTGNTGPYTYQWIGDGNIDINPNNTLQTLAHTFPAPGLYEVTVLITDNIGCQSVLTDSVFIINGPTADAGPDVSTCSGYPINVGSSAIAGQTYSWSPTAGVSAPTLAFPAFNLVNTTPSPITVSYSVSATSGFCTSIDYVDVVVYPVPIASVSGNNQICKDSSTTLTASGGTSYLWSDGSTTQTITVSPTVTTTYVVTAITNGCASQPFAYTVVVIPSPTAIVTGTDSICPGGSAFLTVSGGSTWQWSTGSTNQAIALNNLNTDSTLTVVTSDQGCPGAPVSYTVFQHEKPIGDFVFSAECIENPTTFTDQSTISSGSVIAWRWGFDDPVTGTDNTSNSQNPSHVFSAPGTYNVNLIITSSNGCMDSVARMVTVNPLPMVDFAFDNVCDGSGANFGDLSTSATGALSWNWNFAGQGSSTQQNPSFTFNGPGLFNVSLTVTDVNGCVNTRTKTILIHPNPVPEFTWEFGCFHTVVDFTSTSAVNDPLGTTLDIHSWDFGDPNAGAENTSNDINPTHIYNNPGVYQVTLTVTTSQGCQTILVLPVNALGVPLLQVQNDTVCSGFGGTLLVTAGVQPNTTVEWFYTANSTNPFHFGNLYAAPPADITTTYWVAMEDADGCLSPKVPVRLFINAAPRAQWAFSSQEVEIPNALVEFSILQQLSGPIVSWNWDFGDGNTSNLMEPVHQYNEEGAFDISLTIIDDFGCETSYTLADAINVTKLVAIYVPNAFTPNNDGVNDEFFVSPRLVIDLTIDIYDRWGKRIYSSDKLNFRWAGTDVEGQPLPEGVYTWVINAVEFNGERLKQSGTITLYR